MIKKLQNVDRRLIYFLVLIAIAGPLIKPLGLPFTVGTPAQGVFEHVDALQPGDVVALSFDYSPSGSAQLNPQVEAVMSHLFQKEGVKVMLVSFWPAGPMFADWGLKQIEGQHNKVYGEDYVNFGYIAGAETAISAFAKDIHQAYPKDRQGTLVSDIPMMANIHDAGDIDLFLSFGSGTPGVPEHVRQINNVYGTPMVVGMNSVSVAANVPYYNSGQILGYLNGLRGAAEYESLLGTPGEATKAMDALSFSHLIVIIFILLGNVAYFADPNRKK